MNYVGPIKDNQKFKDIINHLKRNNYRNYILVITGVYTGLRVSDVLKLKIEDVRNKKSINLREKKTNKQNIIALNPILIREYKEFCKDKEDGEYLIKSREGENKAISRVQAYKIIKEAAQAFGETNIGTHSMRKTFGYHYYQKTKDIGTLMKMFNHSAPSITLDYIGVTQNGMDKARREFTI